mmetsp:Transcript_14904/g.40181  ORF Transcript_14904/g.40181 Transcript_14904/m.40181 type:complete len:230 (-) Transcript_14904:185-874(-)
MAAVVGPPRSARRCASSSASCFAVLARLPLESTSTFSSISSSSPASVLWYRTATSSKLFKKASCTAGYLRAKYATFSLAKILIISVFKGSSGHLSSEGCLPIANSSEPSSMICCKQISSGRSPLFRAARHAIKPRAVSWMATLESPPVRLDWMWARRRSHGKCEGATSPMSPRPCRSAVCPPLEPVGPAFVGASRTAACACTSRLLLAALAVLRLLVFLLKVSFRSRFE